MASSRLRARLVGFAGRLTLALVSLAIGGLLAELALRMVLPAPIAPADDRHAFFAYHPRLGWDLVPNTRERTAGPEFDVEVRVNAQGMRDDRVYPVAPAPGTPRIVVVGDSFAFGQGVEASEGFPARLAAVMDGVEVLNLGVTGYGADQQLLKLESVGLGYRPDLVIMALFEGDVFRNDRVEQLGYPKPRFVLDDGALRLVNVPVPRRASTEGWGGRSALGLVAGRPLRALTEHLGFGDAWPITEAIIARLARVCADADVALTVAVLPKDQAVEGSGPRRALHRRTLHLIGELLDRVGVDHLDLTTALTDAWDTDPSTPLYFDQDGHWTPAGHQVVAEALAAHLRQRSTWMRPERYLPTP